MEIFGSHFVIAVRCVQVMLGLLSAYFCMRTARILFDDAAGRVALLAALYCPTLVYFSGEFLSESLAAFFVALFLWAFAEDSANPRWTTMVAMGLSCGLGAMFRPNVAAIGALGVLGGGWFRRSVRTRLQVILLPLCAALIFAPWILRNYEVFGRLILSTKSGTDALCGALNPESRFKPGWENQMRDRVGYLLPNELETNSPSRLALGSEIILDQKCWRATRKFWKEMSWNELTRWTAGKWAAYWFSTDQLLEPGQVSLRNHILHVAAVVFYWFLLALACIGWWTLRNRRPAIARLLFAYVILMTVVHTPFVMNSRIRTPLIDPLIAILAGGGFIPIRVFLERKTITNKTELVV
jgi:4-amino-4-deoxy-L-arabinose transferase-like glycosyltransferase